MMQDNEMVTGDEKTRSSPTLLFCNAPRWSLDGLGPKQTLNTKFQKSFVNWEHQINERSTNEDLRRTLTVEIESKRF